MKIKKVIFGFILTPLSALAGEYVIPACYENVPTTCSFDEMTLEFCNSESKNEKTSFSLSGREYLPGGNKFTSKTGNAVCTVKPIKGSDPTKYSVTVAKKSA